MRTAEDDLVLEKGKEFKNIVELVHTFIEANFSEAGKRNADGSSRQSVLCSKLRAQELLSKHIERCHESQSGAFLPDDEWPIPERQIAHFAGLGRQHQSVLKELVRALERIEGESGEKALKWALKITDKVIALLSSGLDDMYTHTHIIHTYILT